MTKPFDEDHDSGDREVPAGNRGERLDGADPLDDRQPPNADPRASTKTNEELEYEYEDEFDNDLDDEFDDSPDAVRRRNRKRLRLFCFHCNRPEGFYHANRGTWMYSYLIGLTFGLSRWIGPFKCRCCGHRRFFKTDRLHPKMWIKQTKYGS